MGYGLPGSPVHGVSQARTLEEVVISLSRGSPRPRYQTRISCLADIFFTAEPPGKPNTSDYQRGNMGQGGKSGTRDENTHTTVYKIDNQ